MTGVPQRVSITSVISHLPLFADLSAEELAGIAQSTRKIVVTRGDMVFRKNEACTGLFVIARGQVKVYCSSVLGNEKILNILDQGQTLGESALCQGESYQVAAQALSECVLLHLAKARILETLDHNPLFARRVINTLSQSVLDLMQELESYSLHSGRQRVIDYLARETLRAIQTASDLPQIGAKGALSAQEHGKLVIRLPICKGVIASYLNLTPEHFSRVLNELSASGLLSVVGRDIHIPDPARFRKMASPAAVQRDGEPLEAAVLAGLAQPHAEPASVGLGEAPAVRRGT